MKHFLLIIFAALVLSSCSQQPQAETKTKALVLYYSQFSATKTLADSIAQKIGADIVRIEVENDYPADFGQTIARCQEDKANGTLPQLKPINANIADYDIVFLGYPIWFGTYAPPIEALLKQVDFSGKDVVPFCTFGSGGLTESVRDLKAAVPSINIKAQAGVRTSLLATAPDVINRMLIDLGLIEGQNEVLPEFSEMQEVSESDVEIFDAATSSYPMIQATPAKVCSRTTANGTDYIFVANNKDQSAAEIKVYVTKKDNEDPFFTLVER